jgi:hypothetical protein
MEMKDVIPPLKGLVKNGDCRNWPVIHAPFHANTFILAYGYYLALGERLSEPDQPCRTPEEKLQVMKDKIHLEEWTKDMPALVRGARYNIVFASRAQRNAWKQKEEFYFAPIFSYKQKFVLIDRKGPPGLECPTSVKTFPKLCTFLFDKTVSAALDEIRIVSDINPEAWKLRTELVKEFSKQMPPKDVAGRITIVNAKDRSLGDVIGPLERTIKIYLFGGPFCEILAGEDKYKKITYNAESATVDTYLGILSADPATIHLPFSSIFEFFLGIKNLSPPEGDEILRDTAEKFFKYAESRFPTVGEPKYARAFCRSAKHSTLVNSDKFIIECD